MKALVVRPGICEIPEEYSRGKTTHPIYELMHEPTLWKICIFLSLIRSPGAVAVSKKLIELGLEVDATELIEFGVTITDKGIDIQNELISNKLKNEQYDIICISCTSALEYLTTKRMAELCKKILPQSRIVIGGYHASADPYDMMKSIQAIDVLVVGDFEVIAESLISAIKGDVPYQDIPNIYYRENGRINQTERQFIHFNFNKHTHSTIESPFDRFIPFYVLYMIEGSRGCPYNRCSFCAEPLMRKYYSTKSIENIINEIDYIICKAGECHGMNSTIPIGFSDPVWGLKKTWISEFCDKLEQSMKSWGPKLVWRADMRLDQNIQDLYERMYALGCRSIAFGVESFSLPTLKKMNKAVDETKYLENAKKALSAAASVGWDVAINIIFGWPGEQLRDMLVTMEKIAEIRKEAGKNIRPAIYSATPFPGTILWDILDDEEYKQKHGIKLIVQKRFWKKGIIPFVPVFNASRTLSAVAIANYATNSFKKKDVSRDRRKSLWMKDTTFEEKLATEDIITKDDVLHYASIIRKDYVEAGEMCFFEAFSSD